MKIANDLRWMNSGPLAGLGEITLPALQPGTSIMPAKVNPVIPEAVCMAAAQVIGNDTVITLAGQAGNFQLNTMLPLVAANLLRGHRPAGRQRPLPGGSGHRRHAGRQGGLRSCPGPQSHPGDGPHPGDRLSAGRRDCRSGYTEGVRSSRWPPR